MPRWQRPSARRPAGIRPRGSARPGERIGDIAQVVGKRIVPDPNRKDSGITLMGRMTGTKVGVWCCGNEDQLTAALAKNGIDPENKGDVTIVTRPFDMSLLLNRQV